MTFFIEKSVPTILIKVTIVVILSLVNLFLDDSGLNLPSCVYEYKKPEFAISETSPIEAPMLDTLENRNAVSWARRPTSAKDAVESYIYPVDGDPEKVLERKRITDESNTTEIYSSPYLNMVNTEIKRTERNLYAGWLVGTYPQGHSLFIFDGDNTAHGYNLKSIGYESVVTGHNSTSLIPVIVAVCNSDISGDPEYNYVVPINTFDNKSGTIIKTYNESIATPQSIKDLKVLDKGYVRCELYSGPEEDNDPNLQSVTLNIENFPVFPNSDVVDLVPCDIDITECYTEDIRLARRDQLSYNERSMSDEEFAARAAEEESMRMQKEYEDLMNKIKDEIADVKREADRVNSDLDNYVDDLPDNGWDLFAIGINLKSLPNVPEGFSKDLSRLSELANRTISYDTDSILGMFPEGNNYLPECLKVPKTIKDCKRISDPAGMPTRDESGPFDYFKYYADKYKDMLVDTIFSTLDTASFIVTLVTVLSLSIPTTLVLVPSMMTRILNIVKIIAMSIGTPMVIYTLLAITYGSANVFTIMLNITQNINIDENGVCIESPSENSLAYLGNCTESCEDIIATLYEPISENCSLIGLACQAIPDLCNTCVEYRTRPGVCVDQCVLIPENAKQKTLWLAFQIICTIVSSSFTSMITPLTILVLESIVHKSWVHGTDSNQKFLTIADVEKSYKKTFKKRLIPIAIVLIQKIIIIVAPHDNTGALCACSSVMILIFVLFMFKLSTKTVSRVIELNEHE